MIKSWCLAVKGGIEAANMERERLVWELDESLATLRDKILSNEKIPTSLINCASLMSEIAKLNEYINGCGRYIPDYWDRATKLWLRVAKQYGKESWWHTRATQEAAIAARKGGHHWVAACLWVEFGAYIAAGEDFEKAATCEIEDWEGVIDALNKSAEYYEKGIQRMYRDMDSFKEVAIKIQTVRTMAREYAERAKE